MSDEHEARSLQAVVVKREKDQQVKDTTAMTSTNTSPRSVMLSMRTVPVQSSTKQRRSKVPESPKPLVVHETFSVHHEDRSPLKPERKNSVSPPRTRVHHDDADDGGVRSPPTGTRSAPSQQRRLVIQSGQVPHLPIYHHAPESPQHDDRRGGPHRRMVQVAPGVMAPLRGGDETWEAIQNDFYVPGMCMECDITLFVIQDAAYVLCPDCRCVNAMDGHFVDPIAAGVGLGFKYDDLMRWQLEIVQERKRNGKLNAPTTTSLDHHGRRQPK